MEVFKCFVGERASHVVLVNVDAITIPEGSVQVFCGRTSQPCCSGECALPLK